MQNNQKIIAIFGAGGFLGKHLMRELTKLDYRVKVATRNPYLKGYLKPLGNPGQIELFKTNIFNHVVKRVCRQHLYPFVYQGGGLFFTLPLSFHPMEV